VHLLYAPPLERGRCLVIEDLPVLLEVPVELRLPETVRRACLPLRDQELMIERDGEVIRFHVPQVQGHQVVTVEY
jgi:hypothetical protein